MTLTSNDVPPMSVTMMLGSPIAAPRNTLPSVPITGPEWTVRIGARWASAAVIEPPAHCAYMTRPS